MVVWAYTLVSVFIVSLISLIGIFAFFIDEEKIEKTLIYLVSLSVGTLLGGAFLHLIPEAFSDGGSGVSLYIVAGLIVFFVMEKFIHWHHCHDAQCERHGHHHAFSYNILFADGLHNFIDGIIIASSYLISIPLGITTTLAVLFHEIPQEISDFGTLVYAGFSKLKALLFNFASALTSVMGALIILSLGFKNSEITNFLVPFTAGGFIYIAAADLIPELHKSTGMKKSLGQLLFLVAGVAIMAGLLILE